MTLCTSELSTEVRVCILLQKRFIHSSHRDLLSTNHSLEPKDSEKNWTDQVLTFNVLIFMRRWRQKAHKQNNDLHQLLMDNDRKQQKVTGVEKTLTWVEES